MKQLRFWLKVEGLVPRGLSEKIERKLAYGGEQKKIKQKIGFVFGYPFFAGLAILALSYTLFGIKDPLYLIGGFFAGLVGLLIFILLLIDFYSMSRAGKIEKNLPDALELIATNIRSGLTIENALVDSARPEFGELAALFKRAAKEMFSGTSLENALIGISKKIESNILERTVWLITEGIKKGGELGDLLLRVSTDLRNEAAMKKEISANVSMYLTLIIISSAVAAPLLFGAGTVVSDMMTGQTEEITDTLDGVNLPIVGNLFSSDGEESSNPITVEMLGLFSIVSMLVTSLFASFLVGIIKYNREISGIRYFPVIAIIAIVIYVIIVNTLGPIISGGAFF